MSSVYPHGSWFWFWFWFWLSIWIRIWFQLLRRQTSPQAAQNGQSDVSVGIGIPAGIGIGLIGRRLGSGGSHGSIGRGAGGCGLAHCDRYRRVLIVALHHLDGAGIAGGRGAHLSTLRLVQLASDLPVDGLRILRIAFRAENGSGLEQLQQFKRSSAFRLAQRGLMGEKYNYKSLGDSGP